MTALTDSPNANDQPLVGRRILVTRTVQQAGKLSDGLRALGAEPVEVPVLEIRPPDSFDPLDQALRKISSFNWLILTSVNTVQTFAARCAHLGIDFSAIELLSVAAVGSATAEAARKAGFRVTLVPDTYVSESLVTALGNSVAGKRVLFARAKIARNVIPEALSKIGADVVVVDAYQTVLPEESHALLSQAMETGLDAATFTSSSSVRNLAEVATAVGIGFPLKGVPAISIGQVTSATLRELGWEPAIEAEASDIPRLIEAVVKALSR
ncbi:uroporphyrinogen-III synthase [Acidicapsa ligni]|uniref:uroporphyrinogen-III synthase n=1 Tax=Acidicapsa ligni TaxID=542300 RepID=UPI0021E0AD3E|nr:uroporphyrinogen-III synthase [Acidicapsa ligni]